MPQPERTRPEVAAAVAIVIIGVVVVGAVGLLMAGVWRGGRTEGRMPYSIGMVAAGGLAAYLVLARARRLRRQQRPQWLETQAWQQGLADKLKHPDNLPRDDR